LLAGFPRASTFLEVCQARDPKSLWERADKDEIATLPAQGGYTNRSSILRFARTVHLSIEEAARLILGQLDERVFFC
jgi:adenylylsulfate kinase-like enzyme